MRSRAQSSSPPRQRRALQERTSAHTNERSPTRSVRMVCEKEDVDDVDVYTATPFPTKPEQIFLPAPGKGQQEYLPDTRFMPGPSTATWSPTSTSYDARSSMLEHSTSETWDVSSTVDTGDMWEDDPNLTSSKSSLPRASSSKTVDSLPEEDSGSEYSDDEMLVLPTATPTIKPVLSEPPTPPPSEGEPEQTTIGSSSPNVVPIGVPSSPNFMTLNNSSANFTSRGRSYSLTDPRANSLSSYNSHGTVVRHPGAAPWIYTASSEQPSSGSQSFRSTPPYQSVTSFRSWSRRPSGSGGSRSRSGTSSSRSTRSVADLAAAIESGIQVQYPRIRAASSSSRAETSVSTDHHREFTPGRDFTPGPASGRWNPHLSRVSSVFSAEEIMAQTPPPDGPPDNTNEPAAPAAALAKTNTRSTVWLVRNSQEDQHQDSLTSLSVRSGLPTSPSSGSKRSDSSRSLKRPGTATNTIMNILPAWARIYYRADGMGLNSALNMSVWDLSRPGSRPGTGNSSIFGLMPSPLNIPRPRSPEKPRSPERAWITQRRVDSDPRDPRSHWVPGPDPQDIEIVGTPRNRLRHSWSPHLYQDRRLIQYSASGWKAPSIDTTTEPTWSRRNIQVYAFCVGFLFPFSWIIASFLPLPRGPKMLGEMSDPDTDVESALETQLMSLHQRRYENARWWRNLNRWMVSLGVVIFVVIIALAIIGTTNGF